MHPAPAPQLWGCFFWSLHVRRLRLPFPVFHRARFAARFPAHVYVLWYNQYMHYRLLTDAGLLLTRGYCV